MKPKQVVELDLLTALDSLKDESDRGAVVLAGSLVENALGQFLERYSLRHVDKKTTEKLFGPTGPISTFSQRTLVASAFGLIGKRAHQQLDAIRVIRNHFAHHPAEASFNDANIVGVPQKLLFHAMAVKVLGGNSPDIPRKAYISTCSCFLGVLQRDEVVSDSSLTVWSSPRSWRRAEK